MKNYQNRLIGLLVAVPTLAAAIGGLLFPRIYEGVFPEEFLPGSGPQDVLTVLVCLAIIFLSFGNLSSNLKKRIVLIGLLGAIWYLYGIFTIERTYNVLYLLYLISFASSFWGIFYHINEITRISASVSLGKGNTYVSAITSIAIALIFTALWVSSLIPLMMNKNRIEYMYSIYLLDLAFVMPAFFITGIMTLRGKVMGLVLNPAMMILGFFVIFPLGLNELAKPRYGLVMQSGPMAVSFFFSFVMLLIGISHLSKLEIAID